MSNAPVDQAIHDFFRSPTVDYYLAAQQAILASDCYDPAASRIVSLESRISLGHHVVDAELEQYSLEYELCPRWHYLCGRICERKRDQRGVRTAVQRMQLCLRAISETGEGTKNRPFRITYLTDTDDIVRAFGESVRYQQLVASPDGYRDVVTSHSGDEFWFDVEMLLERSSQEAAVAQADHQR